MQAEGKTVALQQEGDKKIILVHEKKFTYLSAEHVETSLYQNNWLLWNDYELWSYEDGSEPQLLTRSGDSLHDVTPIDELGTLLLLSQKNNTIFFPYYFVTHEFGSEPMQKTSVDIPHRLLYFTGSIGKIDKKEGLWKITY